MVLNLIDYCVTNILITTGGEELMPLAASIIEDYGMSGLLFYKLTLTFFVIIASRKFFRDPVWDLLNGVFTGIVLWNTFGIVLGLLFN